MNWSNSSPTGLPQEHNFLLVARILAIVVTSVTLC